ncbi:isocitrate lyase/PEP mutase family protein [Rhodococcus opacus]|uniref:isocitrate lyase/PEP mutase family protein n=1 Tax=Rhodococcus opacus TaxID=37919 RepID=UPI00146B66C5|nr:isocitrate lyase/PEP mutase family protein [Rhodococcus opacus]MDJ0415395.1 isocitrate lyase/PEP mutase family protein [Rhodococcus opacus]MDV7090470.1 isocitrate lyase/PEP mutase family protein [Rhodococcus opacus]WKN52470.1 isocitrate lyase/PEP mutase family protein [Rhodococcus opacus]
MPKLLPELLVESTPLLAPGVYDGLSAKIAQQAGFSAVYVSGGALARSAGVPDLGLLSMTEVRDRTAEICSAVDVPVLADIDTGYGNALNVYRTVTEFVRTGVSALQLEDQVTPKKCGHYSGKELISSAEMEAKIEAAADAVGGAPVQLIARTDAIAVEGFDAALERARRYAAAGADILFVEAPEEVEQIERIATELPGITLLLNMFEGGRTPRVPMTRLAELGYRIVIVPSDLQRAAMRAMQEVAAEIFAHGDSRGMSDKLATFNERDALVDKATWDQRERRAAPQFA